MKHLKKSIENLNYNIDYPPVVCRRVNVLITLLVFVCLWCMSCPTHIVLCFCFLSLRLVYSPTPFSVFYNVYLNFREKVRFSENVRIDNFNSIYK